MTWLIRGQEGRRQGDLRNRPVDTAEGTGMQCDICVCCLVSSTDIHHRKGGRTPQVPDISQPLSLATQGWHMNRAAMIVGWRLCTGPSF